MLAARYALKALTFLTYIDHVSVKSLRDFLRYFIYRLYENSPTNVRNVSDFMASAVGLDIMSHKALICMQLDASAEGKNGDEKQAHR